MWTKIKKWFRNSITILWARIMTFGGLIVGVLVNLSADPSVNSAIQTALQPKYVVWWLIGIGIITELARRRTARKN